MEAVCYDVNEETKHHELIGKAEFKLANLMTSKTANSFKLLDDKGGENGILVLTIEKVDEKPAPLVQPVNVEVNVAPPAKEQAPMSTAPVAPAPAPSAQVAPAPESKKVEPAAPAPAPVAPAPAK